MRRVEQLYQHQLFRWIGRKRGEVSSAIAACSLIDIVWGQAQPVDLFRPSFSNLSLVSWLLMLLGVFAFVSLYLFAR